MEAIPKQYQDLPDSELEEYMAIARSEFSPEQLCKLAFYREWERRSQLNG